LVFHGPEIEPGVFPAGQSAVSFFPFEFWDVPLVSEFGLQRDILQPEVKVPLRVSNLEVVALSMEIIGVAPLISVFPSWEL
jgi:hypothetical protein